MLICTVVYLVILNICKGACIISNQWDTHSWGEEYQWSSMFCCDTSVQGSCKWGVVQTNALTLNISVRAGGEFYKLIKGQLNSGLVSTTTFTMNINMEVNPGRCKWVDIGTTRLNRRVEGECCWWGVSWLCSKDSTEWHRTSTNAMYAMKETDYRNGKIGRGVPIIVEEGMVTGVQEPDLADFTTSS